MANKNIDKFLKFFNLKVVTKDGEKDLVPTDDKGKAKKLSQETQDLLDFYKKNVLASIDSWKDRNELFSDCEEMYLNNFVVSRNVNALSFESLQRDLNDNPVKIEAPNKDTVNHIKEFFDRIKLNDILPLITDQICLYGNSLLINNFDKTGINKVNVLEDIKTFKDRVEFDASQVKRFKETGSYTDSNFLSLAYKSIDRMKVLIDTIYGKIDESNTYDKFLFGYAIDDDILPVWRCVHFRNRKAINPFPGFGTPFFINSISPYTQYVSAMILQSIMRSFKIPIDVFELTLSEGMSPTEKLKRVVEFMSEIQNSGVGAKRRDVKGIGGVRYTIDGLYNWRQDSPDIDLGKIEDIEMLRDDLIATGVIPKEWIDPNESGWGDSGISLKEKSKPFARAVYHIQHILLEGLTQLVKINMIESGRNPDEEPFTLSLPYPQSQVDRDIISSQSDQIRLANDLISAFSDNLMDRNPLPDDIIATIYRQFLPYDDDKIQDWINTITKYKKSQAEETSSEKVYESIKRHGFSNIQEAIDSCAVKIMLDKKRECVIGGYHYFSSKNSSVDFDANFLLEYRVNKIENMLKGKSSLTEEDKFSIAISKEKQILDTRDKNEIIEEEDYDSEPDTDE